MFLNIFTIAMMTGFIVIVIAVVLDGLIDGFADGEDGSRPVAPKDVSRATRKLRTNNVK